MKHKLNIFLTALLSSFFLLCSTAWAHVVVTPKQVGVAEFQTFSVSVPSEKDIPTVALKLLMPSGLDDVTPTVKSGWNINTKQSNGEVTEIDWSGGSIPANFRDDFTFSAQVPATPTQLHWKAYQTYSDGSVVSWDAVPTASDDAVGDKGPYSITAVVNDLNTAPQSTSQNTTAYVISVIAIALAATAFVKSWSAKR